MPVSKGNPDGLVYYLKPDISPVEWNLIIVKQAKGSDSFKDGVDMILETISLGK